MSVNGGPHFTGGSPRLVPVMLMMPLIAWATRSKPPRSA